MKNRLNPEVSALLCQHQHPLEQGLLGLRKLILSADPRIQESVRWNAPSFALVDYFATLNGPKQTSELLIILHTGAKAKGIDMRKRLAGCDEGLEWLGPERAILRLGSKPQRAALLRTLRAWIAALEA